MAKAAWEPARVLRRRFRQGERRSVSDRVRRIERVALPPGQRLLTMACDDGPTLTPCGIRVNSRGAMSDCPRTCWDDLKDSPVALHGRHRLSEIAAPHPLAAS